MSGPIKTPLSQRIALAHWGLPAVIAGVVSLLLFVQAGTLEPPRPEGTGAPATEFSASRARTVLERLLGEERPHPTGSDEHRAVRERLESEIRRLGLEPVSQVAFAAGHGVGAHVHNVFAMLPGPDAGPIVALACHYDSVDAGPGAADDGAGIAAILESARALLAGGARPERVLLLFTDGEELGLLGARAFVEQHPLARDVSVVLNLEARGTAGPSLLFETSSDSRWLLEAFDRGATSPVTASTFVRVYETMPNGTDLSEFARGGWSAANFAFIGGVGRYHTPLDDLAHLDMGSLQHHGDNVLGTTRALADFPLDSKPPDRGVFFDVLSLTVVDWTTAGWLVLVAFMVLLALAVRDTRSGNSRSNQIGAGALFAIAFPSLGLGLGFAYFAATSGLWPGPFPADVGKLAGIPLAVLILTTFALAGPIRRLARLAEGPEAADGTPRAPDRGALTGFWLVWTGIGCLLLFVEPQVGYLFGFPAVVHVIGAATTMRLTRTAAGPVNLLLALPGAVAIGIVWGPFVLLLPDALGATNALGLVAPSLFLAAPVALLASVRLRARLGEWALTVLLASGMSVGSAYSQFYAPDHPQGLTLRYHARPEAGEAQWIAEVREGALPEDEAYAGFAPSDRPSVPPIRTRRRQSEQVGRVEAAYEAPRLDELTRERRADGRVVRGRLVSPRGAHVVTIAVADDAPVHDVEVDGTYVPFRRVGGGRKVVTLHTVPPEGLAISMRIDGTPRIAAELFDETPGLPAVKLANDLIEHRGDAVPFQRRDATLISTELRL